MKEVKRELSNSMKLENFSNGEVGTPEIVRLFFEYLIAGLDARSLNQSLKQRKIDSISQYAVFAATSGVKKPRKYSIVGLALKSLTGCKKAIDMINKLGHCASYQTLEEIET